jgi:hypothetical protein
VAAGGFDLPEALPPITPGILHLSDLVPTPDGWWLLDRRLHRLHQVDRNFQLRFSVGGRGQAPGEFLAPLALATRGDTLTLLAAEVHPVLHHFDLESGEWLHREQVMVPGCTSFRAREIVPHREAGFLLGGTCMQVDPQVQRMGAGVVHVARGTVPRLAWSELLPITPDRMNPDFAILAEVQGATMVARATDPCFHPVPDGDRESASATPLCPREWTAVRLPLEEMARNMGGPDRGANLAAVLGGMETLPGMDRAFPHPEGILLRRLTGLEARSLVLLRPDGSTEVLVDEVPETTWVWGDEIVIAWDGMEGVHVERRPLPAPSRPASASQGG